MNGLKITVTVEMDDEAYGNGASHLPQPSSAQSSDCKSPAQKWLVVPEKTCSDDDVDQDLKPGVPEDVAVLKQLASYLTSSKAKCTPQERINRAYALGQTHSRQLESDLPLTHPGSVDLQNGCWVHPDKDTRKTWWTNCKSKRRDLVQKVSADTLFGFPTTKEAEAYFLGFGAGPFNDLRY